MPNLHCPDKWDKQSCSCCYTPAPRELLAREDIDPVTCGHKVLCFSCAGDKPCTYTGGVGDQWIRGKVTPGAKKPIDRRKI